MAISKSFVLNYVCRICIDEIPEAAQLLVKLIFFKIIANLFYPILFGEKLQNPKNLIFSKNIKIPERNLRVNFTSCSSSNYASLSKTSFIIVIIIIITYH